MQNIKLSFLKIWNTTIGYWLILTATFIVCRLATWVYPYDSDHWIFYYLGKDWFHGGSLYMTAWDHKPPVIFFINGFMSVLLGDNIVLHRLLFTAISIVGIYLFYRLAKLTFSLLLPDRTTLGTKIATLVYVFWSNLQQFTSSGNNNENFGLIFFMGMLLSYFSYRRDKRWWQLLLAGSCFSVLFFMKGNFILLGVPVGIMMLFDYWKDLRKLVSQSLIFVLPFFVHAGLWTSYFLSKGTLGEAIIASFSFSAKYSGSAWKGDLSDLNIFYMLIFIASPLLILAPAVYLSLAKRRYKNDLYLYLAMTLVLGSLAFFAVGVPYLYYFQILMPIYAIISTFVLLEKKEINKYFYTILTTIFLIGSLMNLGYSTVQILRWNVGNTVTEAKEFQEIADFVDKNSAPSDKVFVADYGATFYQLSQRSSGSRFISASVLLLDYRDRYGFNLNDKFIGDMEKSKAKYVVVYKDKSTLYYKNLPVVSYFDQKYHIEKEFVTFEVLRRN